MLTALAKNEIVRAGVELKTKDFLSVVRTAIANIPNLN